MIAFIIFAAILSSAALFLMGMYFGQQWERRRWNDLIDQGKIPRPR